MNKILSFLFPVKKEEVAQFFILSFLMFFIIINNTLVRNLKDTFLVLSNGALSIAFIKMWGVLPAIFLSLLGYGKLSNVMKQEKIFYLLITLFLCFFALFGFVLMPYHESLQFHELGDWLRAHLPNHFKEMIGLIEYWNYSLFYIVSELWSSIVISLLFWQFANSVILKEQAKRFYPLFGQVADVGMILGGVLLVYFSSHNSLQRWCDKVQNFTWLILISGVCTMLVYAKATRTFKKMKESEQKASEKPQLSLKETLSFLSGAPNLRFLAMMVLGCAIASNLIEIAWKCELQSFCQGEAQFTQLMGYFSIFTGVFTILLAFLCSYLLRIKGWLFGALLPPIFTLIVGVSFFGILILQSHFRILDSMGYLGSFLIPLIGSLQNVVGKSIKFSLFDPTKEMAFIPLDIESRTKGKAAIDLLGVRMGKSVGSLFHQSVAIGLGSFEAALGLYLGFFLLILAMWIKGAQNLYYKYVRDYAF